MQPDVEEHVGEAAALEAPGRVAPHHLELERRLPQETVVHSAVVDAVGEDVLVEIGEMPASLGQLAEEADGQHPVVRQAALVIVAGALEKALAHQHALDEQRTDVGAQMLEDLPRRSLQQLRDRTVVDAARQELVVHQPAAVAEYHLHLRIVLEDARLRLESSREQEVVAGERGEQLAAAQLHREIRGAHHPEVALGPVDPHRDRRLLL